MGVRVYGKATDPHDVYRITVEPEEGAETPTLPLLQPGNFYKDERGATYRITRTEVEVIEARRGVPTYRWMYRAVLEN